MNLSYSWDWLQLKLGIGIIYPIAVGVGLMLYSRRIKNRQLKRQNSAYGMFFIFIGIVMAINGVLSGLKINNPNIILATALSVIVLLLVYYDGRITQKVVGSGLAVEANPFASFLFRKLGFKKVRIGIGIVVAGYIIAILIREDLVTIMFLCLVWVLVDSNNVIAWYRLRKGQHMRDECYAKEIDFEGIQEL